MVMGVYPALPHGAITVQMLVVVVSVGPGNPAVNLHSTVIVDIMEIAVFPVRLLIATLRFLTLEAIVMVILRDIRPMVLPVIVATTTMDPVVYLVALVQQWLLRIWLATLTLIRLFLQVFTIITVSWVEMALPVYLPVLAQMALAMHMEVDVGLHLQVVRQAVPMDVTSLVSALDGEMSGIQTWPRTVFLEAGALIVRIHVRVIVSSLVVLLVETVAVTLTMMVFNILMCLITVSLVGGAIHAIVLVQLCVGMAVPLMVHASAGI